MQTWEGESTCRRLEKECQGDQECLSQKGKPEKDIGTVINGDTHIQERGQDCKLLGRLTDRKTRDVTLPSLLNSSMVFP